MRTILALFVLSLTACSGGMYADDPDGADVQASDGAALVAPVAVVHDRAPAPRPGCYDGAPATAAMWCRDNMPDAIAMEHPGGVKCVQPGDGDYGISGDAWCAAETISGPKCWTDRDTPVSCTEAL